MLVLLSVLVLVFVLVVSGIFISFKLILKIAGTKIFSYWVNTGKGFANGSYSSSSFACSFLISSKFLLFKAFDALAYLIQVY